MSSKKDLFKDKKPCKVSAEELKDFHAVTLARISETRRHMDNKSSMQNELNRRDDHAFRDRYYQSVKQKRRDEIVNLVDRQLVKETIPDMQDSLFKSKRTVNFMEEKTRNEANLQGLVVDLVSVDTTAFSNNDPRRDSGNIVIKVDNDQRASFGFESSLTLKSCAQQFVERIASFDLSVSTRLASTHDNNKGSKIKGGVAKFSPTSLSSSLRSQNQMQISALIEELLVDATDSGQIKIQSGLMGNLMQRINEPRQAREQPPLLERRNSVYERQSSTLTMSKLLPNLASITHADGGEINRIFSGIIDGLYVIGPSRRMIISGVKENSGGSHKGSGKGSPARFRTFTAQASVLATSFKANSLPSEMVEVLPPFCFPLGVEVLSAESSPMNQNSVGSTSSRRLQLDPSVLANDANGGDNPSGPLTDGSRLSTGKRKMRFFSSDYSMKAGAPVNIATATSPSIPLPTSKLLEDGANKIGRSVFVMKFGDKATYESYAICFQMPVKLFDEEVQISVNTSYTVCFFTQLIHISLLTQLIEVWDTAYGVFSFLTMLESLTDGNGANISELESLFNMANELKSTRVPLYPYLLKARRAADSKDEADDKDGKQPRSPIEYHSFLPEMDLPITLSTSNDSQSPLQFKRSFFQRYFSAFPPKSEQLNPSDFQKMHDQLSLNQFNPGVTHKAEREREESFFLLQWSLPILLSHFPVEQVILALSSALYDKSIVVYHPDPAVITGCIFAIITLLRPLKYSSPVFYMLPESLLEMIEGSPFPMIIGTRQLPASFHGDKVPVENLAVLHPDKGTIFFCEKELLELQNVFLPNGSKLAVALQVPASTIKKLSRKRKLEQHQKLVKLKSSKNLHTSVGNRERFNSSGSQSVDETIPTPNISLTTAKLSADMDPTNPDCGRLAGAINQFSTLVYNHISALVNTAITWQQDEKRVAREKRRLLTRGTSRAGSMSDISSSTKRNDGLDTSRHRTPSRGNLLDDSNLDGTNSVGSTSSSLPSVRTGAPIFIYREMKSYEHNFMTRLIDNLMFANYCQAQHDAAHVISSNVALSLTVDINLVSNATTSDPSGEGSGEPKIIELGGEGAVEAEPILGITRTRSSSMEDVAEEVDSLVDLFAVLLTGTIAMDPSQINEQRQKYEELYQETVEKLDENTFVPMHNNKFRKIYDRRQKLLKHLDRVLQTVAEQDYGNNNKLNISTIRTCSGLMCNGFCNTDLCDGLCLQLWQKKLAVLRRKQAAFQIVSAKYEHPQQRNEDGSVPLPMEGKWIMDSSDGYGKLKLITPKGVRMEAVKHGRETKSQYLLRKKVIASTLNKKIKDSDVGALQSAKKVRSSAILRLPLEDGGRREVVTRTFSNSNNVYITSMARYFSKREKKIVDKFTAECHRIRERFILYYIRRYRSARFFYRIAVAQAIIRGYLVRKDIPTLVEKLLLRKVERLMATIRIRNAIRNNVDGLLSALEKKKEYRRKHRNRRINADGSPPKLISIVASERYGSGTMETVRPDAFDLQHAGRVSSTRSVYTDSATDIRRDRLPSVDGLLRKSNTTSLTSAEQNFLRYGVKPVRRESFRHPLANRSFSLSGRQLPASPSQPPARPSHLQVSSTVTLATPQLSSVGIANESGLSSLHSTSQSEVTPQQQAVDPFMSPNTFPMVKSPPSSGEQSDGDRDENTLNIRMQQKERRLKLFSRSKSSEAVMEDSHHHDQELLAATRSTLDEASPTRRRPSFDRRSTSSNTSHSSSNKPHLESISGLLPEATLSSPTANASHQFQRKENVTSDVDESFDPSLALSASHDQISSLSAVGESMPVSRASSRGNVFSRPASIIIPPIVSLSKTISSGSHHFVYSASSDDPSQATHSTGPFPQLNERRNVTPIGRYTQSQHIIIPSSSSFVPPKLTNQNTITTLPAIQEVSWMAGDDFDLDNFVRDVSSNNNAVLPNSFDYNPDSPTSLPATPKDDLISPRSPGGTSQRKQPSSSPAGRSLEFPWQSQLQMDGDWDDGDDYQEGTDGLLDEDAQLPPFRTMGDPVFEIYKHQQRSAIAAMYHLLLQGIEVTKHSRSGKPKSKVVSCNPSMTRISWRSASFSGPSRGWASLGGGGAGTTGTYGDDSDNEDGQMIKGSLLGRYSHAGGGGGDKDRDKVVEIREITEISKDLVTDVMRRSDAKRYLKRGFPLLSLITPQRTLDLEIEDEEIRDTLLQGLILVRNYYHQLLPALMTSQGVTTGYTIPSHHNETEEHHGYLGTTSALWHQGLNYLHAKEGGGGHESVTNKGKRDRRSW